VVVYASGTDAGVEQAALAAGALAVLNKMAMGPSVVDWLADILVGHWASPKAVIGSQARHQRTPPGPRCPNRDARNSYASTASPGVPLGHDRAPFHPLRH
jgi:hypothetical protein